MKKLSKTEAELKKSVAYKNKRVVIQIFITSKMDFDFYIQVFIENSLVNNHLKTKAKGIPLKIGSSTYFS